MRRVVEWGLRQRFFRYTFIGGLATVVDWTTFSLLAIFTTVHYELNLVAATCAGALTNYVGNRVFTFESRTRRIHHQLGVFVLITAISLGISAVLIYLLHARLGIAQIPSRILVTLLMLPVNYWFHKSLTFNKRYFL